MLFKNKCMKQDLGNWRGIMLLDAAPKIVCAIFAGRLTRLLEAEQMEEPNSFMPHCGTTDGIFSLKILLQKRKEHGLSTWVVFIDLVKAFDSVPRDGLYKMLQKMTLPESLRTLIIALHTDFMVKIKSGLEDVETSYTTRVKQGDSLAPILFLLYFQMCIEILDSRWTVAKPSFVFKMDGRPMKGGAHRWSSSSQCMQTTALS